ncbi:hypothetical protein SANTM175S_07663 [Streptomyces antimycoticus]
MIRRMTSPMRKPKTWPWYSYDVSGSHSGVCPSMARITGAQSAISSNVSTRSSTGTPAGARGPSGR